MCPRERTHGAHSFCFLFPSPLSLFLVLRMMFFTACSRQPTTPTTPDRPNCNDELFPPTPAAQLDAATTGPRRRKRDGEPHLDRGWLCWGESTTKDMRTRPHRDWSLDDAMNGCFATHQGPTPTQPREEEKHPSSLEAERDIRHTPFPSRKRQTLAVDKKNTHTRQGKAAGIQSRGATQPTKSGAGNWFACPALLLPPPHPFPPNSRLDTPTTTRIPIDDAHTHPTTHPHSKRNFGTRLLLRAGKVTGSPCLFFAGQVKVFRGTRTVWWCGVDG